MLFFRLLMFVFIVFVLFCPSIIKIYDKPITIKTIEIDGKKMTKQFLQQIELVDLTFVNNGEIFLYKEFMSLSIDKLENFEFYDKPIGYINILLDKDSTIKSYFQRPNLNIDMLCSIIFIDESENIFRGYVQKSKCPALFGDAFPQIFI